MWPKDCPYPPPRKLKSPPGDGVLKAAGIRTQGPRLPFLCTECSALRARFAASGMEPTIIDLGPVPSAIRDTRGLLEAVHAYNRGQVLDAVSLPQVAGGHLPEAAALILGVPASQAQPSRFLAEPPAAWTSRMREQSQGIII